MQTGAVARLYASSLCAVATENGQLDQVERDLEFVVDTLAAEPTLRGVINHPEVTPAAKKEIIARLFAGKVSPYVTNLLRVLIDKKRQRCIEEIAGEYKARANEARGVLLARVRTARELSPAVWEMLRERLSAALGRTVELVATVDPALIGGIAIQVGDHVLDGSVATRLDVLRKKIAEAPTRLIE